jgi:acetyl esterase
MLEAGTHLDPEIAAVLGEMAAAAEKSGVPAHEVPIEQSRRAHDQDAEALCGPGEPCLEVREVDAGGVRVRLFRPLEGDLPLIVYLHGGGWAIGSLNSFDAVCRALANRAGAIVASVDYRLAPEHPYPAALDDSLAAFDWLLQEIAHTQVAVGGDSAGGALAAIVARERREQVDMQLLVYPVCDAGQDTASYARFAEGFGLTAATMHRFWSLYAGEGDRSDPRLCPLVAEDLAGLPPAHVVLADHDVLHDEGEAYARRLQEAGVPVTLCRYPGTIHGFWRWLAKAEVSRRAVDEAGAALQRALR